MTQEDKNSFVVINFSFNVYEVKLRQIRIWYHSFILLIIHFTEYDSVHTTWPTRKKEISTSDQTATLPKMSAIIQIGGSSPSSSSMILAMEIKDEKTKLERPPTMKNVPKRVAWFKQPPEYVAVLCDATFTLNL